MPAVKKAVKAVKAEAKREREWDLERAATWCKANNKKARCREVTAEFPNVSQSALRRRLEQKVVIGKANEAKMLRTYDEEDQLVRWLRQCKAGGQPKKRTQISAKIVHFLKLRRAQNRRLKHGRARVKFSPATTKTLVRGEVSALWFVDFFARNSHRLSSKPRKKVKSQRAGMKNEEAIEDHFEGKFGLSKELLDAKIMHPETARDHEGRERGGKGFAPGCVRPLQDRTRLPMQL